MHLRSVKRAPVAITLCVLVLVCFVHALPAWLRKSDEQEAPRFDFFQRLEWMTYDARVRLALRFPRPYATNLLGAVFIDDRDLTALNDGSYGYRVKFPWPRYFFGRALNELAAQGASLVGVDIFFDQTDPDTIIEGPGRRRFPSDQYFADQLRNASNVVLAADARRPIFPAPMFETHAVAVGNVYTKVDSDGILRKARAFVERRIWHPAIVSMARALNWDLGRVEMQADRMVFSRLDGQPPDYAPLGQNGALKFDGDGELIVNRDGSGESAKIPGPGAKPYTDTKVWQLGIILAAHHLGLDLDHPVIERDRIILRGNGQERIIPVDRDGFFYVDWTIRLNDTDRIEAESIVRLIRQSEARDEGQADFEPKFRGKLVVIGSIGTGGNVSDHGATPLENETVLVSKHWNVANAVLMDHFIHRTSLGTELLLIALFGVVSGVLSWALRVYLATASVLLVSLAYSALAAAWYVQSRHWLPIFMPVVGGLLLPHFALITYRVVFEERERDRVKAVFAKIGLMGSDAHIVNYTVFGREVNVASRLEKIAGRGGIIISGATHAELQRADPALAAACLERPPVQVKGIREPVNIYEVLWKQDPGTSGGGLRDS